MTGKSPDFLTPKPQVKKANRKVLGLIIGVIALMGLVLLLSMTSQKKEAKDAAPPQVLVEEKPLVPKTGDGLGLAVPLTEKKPETREEKAEGAPQIKVVGPPSKDEEAEAARREAEEIRRRKLEIGQQALSSSLIIKREGPKPATASDDQTTASPERGERPYAPAAPDAYAPAADQDKEAFFTRADAAQWLSPYTREAGRKYELKTGTVIPGIMVSGINSDLPGNLIAQVSQNVYDTATGRHLLIPQGAKLYGVYDSRVIYGQNRVLTAWNRVIFPDGSCVTLGAMPGADISGYAGFKDQVDNHYLRIFGSAVMMSLVTGGMSYAVDKVANNDSSGNGNANSTTMQDEMTAALAAQLGQATLQLLQKNMNIKPTLEIRPGYQFNVVVTKDVAFAWAYAN